MRYWLSINLRAALLILAFALYTHLDREELYKNIILITILSNLMAHLIPALGTRMNRGSSFWRLIANILVASSISIAIYVGFVSVYNILTVPGFLENIPLLHFITFNVLVQLGFAAVAALVAALTLKAFAGGNR